MKQPTPRREVGWGIVGAGLAVAIIVSLHPEKLNAPAWVAYLAAGAFVLGGLIVVFRSAARTRAAEGMVCALLALFACIGAWVAVGPGGAQCSGGFAGVAFQASATNCRVAFGTGTLVVAAMFAFAVRNLLRSPAAGNRSGYADN